MSCLHCGRRLVRKPKEDGVQWRKRQYCGRPCSNERRAIRARRRAAVARLRSQQ